MPKLYRSKKSKDKHTKKELQTKPEPGPPPPAQTEEIQVIEEEEEELDNTPQYNQPVFQFLIDEKPEHFYEGNFELNRPFRASVDFLENPHGSVKLYQGDTCVVAGVYGPAEIRMSKELPHRAAVDVLFRPKVTGTNPIAQLTGWDSTLEERAIESKLTSILETVLMLEDDLGAGFNIILHEVENDGCLFSSCVNATALALLNGGCPLRCTFAAVTIFVDGNTLIVDPSMGQQSVSTATKITYVLSNANHVLHTSTTGRTCPQTLRTTLTYAQKASKEIFSFYKEIQLKECQSFKFDLKNKLESMTLSNNEDV